MADILTRTDGDVWTDHWASAINSISSSAIRELLKVTEQPGVISFAGGLPSPDCFPAEEISLAAERVMAREAARVLQYGPTEGFPPLRELLAVDPVVAQKLPLAELDACFDEATFLRNVHEVIARLDTLSRPPGSSALPTPPTTEPSRADG